MVLELWGSGFNAHGQLLPARNTDIRTPALLTTGKASLKPLEITWSSLTCIYVSLPPLSPTLTPPVERDGTTTTYGTTPSVPAAAAAPPPPLANVQILKTAASMTSTLHLTSTGQVLTAGDSRHSLGRRPSTSTPAGTPCPVPSLVEHKIHTIAAGGFMGAAIDEMGGCYVWGSPPPPDAAEEDFSFLPEYGEVALVELDEDEDVVDVAVGSGHVLVLGESGRVWAAGRAECGQTPAGDGTWRRWEPAPWKGRVTAVFAGPEAWCSLVLVEREG
ncbi:regulator of chromosome condensation 1/beta-lactamase-inhibitor protein II [Sphaerosporella brunnea]|uniref:Regulator of chromosome condensation 1/beta-lactamase-inhibitor protein II n=1 Tax=Sphaerosporella brunnea TaxID=1250544 RepID=A0A5J5ET25_9PEZI|nr:regulator of chromosome condensation 1/beta-lactamase-inhibitor protein II [Sphaerosporella brunnea]